MKLWFRNGALLSFLICLAIHFVAAGALFPYPAAAGDRKLVIGYTGAPASVDYWKKLQNALLERAKSLDVVLVSFSAEDFLLERQSEDIERAIDAGVDGLIIGPISNAISDRVDRLREHNIPVVVVGVPLDNEWVSSTIATDNSVAARIAGLFLKDRIAIERGTEGRVIILCGDTAQVDAVIRAQVPQQILSDAGYDVAVYFARGWSAKHALEDAIKEFAVHGDAIVGGFSCFADGTVAMVEAAESFGLNPVLVGFDLDENMRTMIAEGRLEGAVAQDPGKTGELGLEHLVDAIRGKHVPQKQGVPARLITRENHENF